MNAFYERSITLPNGKKITLRRVKDEDHIFLVDLHNDPLVLRNITDPTPITMESHMRWWKSIDFIKQERYLLLVDETPAGFCKFYNVDRNNENCVLGADLHKDFRGHGLAKYMWLLMIEHAFNDLNLHRISLTTAEYNKVGKHVYSGLGFKIEGIARDSLKRDESYFSEIYMGMLKKEWKLSKFFLDNREKIVLKNEQF